MWVLFFVNGLLCGFGLWIIGRPTCPSATDETKSARDPKEIIKIPPGFRPLSIEEIRPGYTTIRECTTWKFKKAIPSLQLPAGVTGMFVRAHGAGEPYEAVLFGEEGVTIGVQSVKVCDLSFFGVECTRESDGRYSAEIPLIPGALTYGESAEEAKEKANELALCVLADEVVRASEYFWPAARLEKTPSSQKLAISSPASDLRCS